MPYFLKPTTNATGPPTRPLTARKTTKVSTTCSGPQGFDTSTISVSTPLKTHAKPMLKIDLNRRSVLKDASLHTTIPHSHSHMPPLSVLTREQIKRDLSRKPPPPPASASTCESHASLRGLVLCLLLQQQLQLQATTSDDTGSTQQQVARDLKSTEAALWQAAADVVEEGDEGAHINAPHDFEMAETWGKEAADDVEDTAREAAPTKEWYLKLLAKYNVLPVRLILPISTSYDNTCRSNDESEHQSMRDIERDSLKVNGAVYQPGGLGGHTRVLAWLEGVFLAHLQASGCSPLPPKKKLEAFIRHVLRQVNRTNSAGAAYDAISKRLGVEEVTAIVPDSRAAEPLEIEVDTGTFPLPLATASANSTAGIVTAGTAAAAAGGGGRGRFGWGLRARLRTATCYVIYDEAVEEEWMSVRAEYKETVCLPLVVVDGGGGMEGGMGKEVARQQPLSLGASVRLSGRKK